MQNQSAGFAGWWKARGGKTYITGVCEMDPGREIQLGQVQAEGFVLQDGLALDVSQLRGQGFGGSVKIKNRGKSGRERKGKREKRA